MKLESWKILAITSTTLLVILTIIFGLLLGVGVNIIEQEDACAFACFDQGGLAYQIENDFCFCSFSKYDIRRLDDVS